MGFQGFIRKDHGKRTSILQLGALEDDLNVMLRFHCSLQCIEWFTEKNWVDPWDILAISGSYPVDGSPLSNAEDVGWAVQAKPNHALWSWKARSTPRAFAQLHEKFSFFAGNTDPISCFNPFLLLLNAPLTIKAIFSDLKINEISLCNAIKILPKIGFRSFPLILNKNA